MTNTRPDARTRKELRMEDGLALLADAALSRDGRITGMFRAAGIRLRGGGTPCLAAALWAYRGSG